MTSTALLASLCVVVAMVMAGQEGHPDHPPEQMYSRSPDEASDYLMSSWRDYFHSIDVNYDGVVSMQDVDDTKSRYINLAKQHGELDESKVEKLDHWWRHYVFMGSIKDINEAEFLDLKNSEYILNKQAFEDLQKESLGLIWDVLDINGDEFISRDEFALSYTVFGNIAIARDELAFLALKPESLVPLSRLVHVHTSLAIDDAGPSFVKDTFAKDGFE